MTDLKNKPVLCRDGKNRMLQAASLIESLADLLSENPQLRVVLESEPRTAEFARRECVAVADDLRDYVKGL